ncbi:MAG: hypothetical protein K9M82_05355 [Deltaproteobacteria bacterium]|nr:hypothetical protein [Deltaproteobacteria bacterium]
MSRFRASFQGERLALRGLPSEAAGELAFHLCLDGLSPGTDPAGRVLDLSGALSSADEDPLPALLLEAVHGLAAVLADRFLFLHGCAFGFEGKAALFCGPSGAGKTTLAMVAEHLGFPALGEDLVVVDWERGWVHGLAMPFRPRPFTRELLDRWYRDRGGSWARDAPVRPGSTEGTYPLERLFLAGAGKAPAVEALLACAFGRAHLDPAVLVRRAATALKGCTVHRCPQVRIAPGTSEARMKKVMDQWLRRPQDPWPTELFGIGS